MHIEALLNLNMFTIRWQGSMQNVNMYVNEM